MNPAKYLVEFIGTFFLVFTIGMAVIGARDTLFAPIAIGAVLTALVYAGGHISGAHYNPAVTLAVFIRGKCKAADVVPYMIAQFVAALVAGFAVLYMKQGETVVPVAITSVPAALLAEFLFTFALAFVILNVATAKATEGNSYFGLAIGITVLGAAYAIGPVSGAALNPAVALGALVMGLLRAADIWIHLVGSIAGAFAAAGAFRALVRDNP